MYGGWEGQQILMSDRSPVAQLPSPAEPQAPTNEVHIDFSDTSMPEPEAPKPLPEVVPPPRTEENFSRLVEDLRTKLPENNKMSQMDIIQRDIKKTSEDMPIVQLVDAVFRQAVNKKASDIHIEPFTDHTEIRFRIDGVLRPVMTVPKEFENSLLSRIKVMANLDITENRQPQDGRVMTEVANRPVDLRISTLPIIHGEKCVIRILDKGANKFEFAKLGFSEKAEATIKSAIENPNGIILVTGPTGSGKSTTLYTAPTTLNSPEVNIVTLEDPVEYQLARVNQVQVNNKVGLTFAKGLRSILRQDPDVIMVGEIRDLETAEISIQAALTGHLVLSTLHTNDAPSAITRLRYMKVEPFLISASLLLVVAQRLARVLCPQCKQPGDAPQIVMDRMVKASGDLVAQPTIFKAKGCENCNQTGYRGRKGLYEIFKMTAELREMTVDPKSSLEDFRGIAKQQGMRTLFEEGSVAVLSGVTSVEEMLRVCTIEVTDATCLNFPTLPAAPRERLSAGRKTRWTKPIYRKSCAKKISFW